MKESINLASSFIQESPPKTPNFGKFQRYLIISNVVSAALLLVTILTLITFSFLTARENSLKHETELKFNALSEDKKIIDSLVKRQQQLEYVKTQRPDLKKTVSAVQDYVPEDTTLTKLAVFLGGATVSAKTPTVTSFSQFVSSLISSKFFKRISLTGSNFDQSTGFFSFTLECLTT